jgi:hypothetical protein
MRVVAEPVQVLLDVLVDVRVVGDRVDELVELLPARQLAVQEQVRDLEVARLLGQLLDGVAAVLEDALVAVDEGDGAPAVRGVEERRVVAHETEVVIVDLDLAQVRRLDAPVLDRDLVGLAGAVVGDRQSVFGHGVRRHFTGKRLDSTKKSRSLFRVAEPLSRPVYPPTPREIPLGRRS